MIIVTGGCGFVGSHLVDKLIALGHKVLVIDNFTTGNRKNFNPNAKLWRGAKQFEPGALCGVHQYFRFVDEMVKEPVEVIFHLTASPRIQPSFENPSATYENNSSGTIVALEMARHHKAKLIYAGSSTADSDVFLNPYAYSKWLGEQHCKLYNKLYGVEGAIARFYNVFGPRQIETGPNATVIGIWENQYRQGKPLTVTGNGTHRRDFTHVDDVANGLIAMSKEDWHFTQFSLGTGRNHALIELAEMFKCSIEFVPARPGEARNTQASIKYTKKMLGWKPEKNIEDYIKGVVG